MKENINCKIIEDLLLSYIDDTLNLETKQIVDEHLSQCDNCRQKLSELKSSLVEQIKNDKKIIDYLKKAKIKERITTLKWIVIIILLAFLTIFIRNFFIINNIHNKGNKYLSENNIYVQKVEHQPNNSALITKYYYKEGKCKKICETYSNNNLVSSNTDCFSISSEEFKNIFNSSYLPYNSGLLKNIGHAFGISIFSSIHTEKPDFPHYENQKTYALVDKSTGIKIWYDKKTGLKLKEIISNVQPSYYQNTSIMKNIQDQITEYKYEFNIVSDEDVLK